MALALMAFGWRLPPLPGGNPKAKAGRAVNLRFDSRSALLGFPAGQFAMFAKNETYIHI